MNGRAEWVENEHPFLSLRTQCGLLGVSRSSLDYVPALASAEDLKIMRIMDEIYLRDPCIGARRIVQLLERDHALCVNRKRVSRLRRVMGIETIFCRPRTSVPEREHAKFPYLLREKNITRANEAWCSDICQRPPALPFGQRLRPLAVSLRSIRACRWRAETRSCAR